MNPAEIQSLKKEILSSLHCALPGIVESFDAETQTASVRPAVRNLPLLRDVPVFFPGTRGSAVTWPVAEGDECLLIFADSDIDAWFDSGEAEEAASGRKHALPDAFAFVGFRSRPNALEEFPEGPRFFDGAMAPHTHDDRYYTESEMDTKLGNKLDKGASSGIAYGTCATEAATAEKVIRVSGKTGWALEAGALICVKFTYTNTAQNPTFDVNGTGAKRVMYNTSLISTSSLGYAGYASRLMLFAYDGAQYVFLGWSIDANTTYSNASLGQGYGTCATAEATAEKAVTLGSYALTTGGYVAVKFTYAVPASATLNVNSKGAKPIYYMGAAIPAGIIQAGDTATFVYNGSQYHLVGLDRQVHKHSAADITSGTLALGRGGTGQTATGATSTIADIATAATDCEITTAQYAWWGKVAMVRLAVKKTTAVSSGTTTLCTLVSGKRPKYNASGTWAWNKTAQISTGGVVQVNGAITAGTTLTILATYILA